MLLSTQFRGGWRQVIDIRKDLEMNRRKTLNFQLDAMDYMSRKFKDGRHVVTDSRAGLVRMPFDIYGS